MYIDRYKSDSLLGGKILSTNGAIRRLRDAFAAGQISTTSYVVKEGERLDVLAGRFYGDGRLWWVIAAASGIGWWVQVPPGTQLYVPTDLTQVQGLV